MTIKINGTNTTAQPSITGTDTDTGLVYGTDQVQVVTGGTTRVTVDSSGAATFGGVGTFSGDLRVQDGGNFRVRTAADASSDAILLQNNGNITASGGATFGSNVQAGGNPISGTANGSVVLSDSGFIAANSNAAVPLWRGYTTGNSTQTSSILATGAATFNGVLKVNRTASGDGCFNADLNGVTKASITSAGTAMFAGNVKFQSGRIYVQNSASGTGDADGLALISDGNADKYLWNYDNTTLRFGTNNTERMRIANAGETFIYSTDHGFYTQTTIGAGTVKYLYRGANSGGSNIVFNVWSNGNVESGTGSYGNVSDLKLKENIIDASSQWADIKAVKVRNFNFKADSGYETHKQIGIIAQEIDTVSSGLVYETPDTDADGNELDTVTKKVKTSVLYMKAVKALQEAMTRIETLETQNASLEARLTTLEGGAS